MSRAPVPGILVRWVNGPSGSDIGLVTEVTNAGKRVRIDFDSGEERIFAWPNGVLERMVFAERSHVAVHDHDQIGVVESIVPVEDVLYYSVQLPGGELVMVSEASLRPATVTDPIQLLTTGVFHSTRSVNLRTVATQLQFASESGELSSLSSSRVEVKPHQVWVTHRATSAFPHRFLLADEVGLGKTIEAGLIIKELKARKVVERILVIAPSGIVSQWQFELKNKFNEVFSRYNRETVTYLKTQHPNENVWTLRNQVVVSDAYASYDEKRRAQISEVDWDLVVIDEAHHARRGLPGSSSTNLYKLAEALAQGDPNRGLLLLTATPLQLHRSELYSLVDLLDPALFPDFQDFDNHCASLSGLNRTLERVLAWDSLSHDERDLTTSGLEEWLALGEGEATQGAATTAGRLRLRQRLLEKHKLSEVMLRNRKSVVGGFMPRVAIVWPVDLTEDELVAYDAVTDYCRTGYRVATAINDQAMGFVMATFQKMNSSSSFAAKQSLMRRIAKLEGKALPRRSNLVLDEADVEEKGTEALDPWLGWSSEDRDEEVVELQRVVGLLDRVRVDSKTEVLLKRLSELVTRDPNVKVLLFTQSRDTLEYLSRRISEPWSVEQFHGQLKPQEKDETVALFREGIGPHIMLSTEAGGEGRNFQFCNILINYDLPWNPMKIEQRIGRLDRIGQKHPVKVINFSLRGTIEERVLEVLDQRIKIFEETIGGLDPILGGVEQDLKKLFLLADEEAEKALNNYGRTLEDRVAQAREAEEKLADFIMDTKSFRQDETRALLERADTVGNDLVRRFVINSLAELGCHIREEPPTSGIYSITYHGQFLIDFPDFGKEDITVRGTFHPAVAQEHEDIEFFAVGHRLVDALMNRALQDTYPGRTSRRLIRTDEHEGAQGWFFTFGLEFHGVFTINEVFPVFLSEDGYSSEISEWILNRTARLKFEEPSSEELREPPDPDQLAQEALSIAMKRLVQLQSEIAVTNRSRAEKEKAKLLRFFDYRKEVARQKVSHAAGVVARLEGTNDPESLKILPAWKKNLENAERVVGHLQAEQDRQISELAQREQIKAKQQLLTASFVTIQPSPDGPVSPA